MTPKNTYPGLTRFTHNTKSYVALGQWTEEEMREAVERRASSTRKDG